MLRAVGWFCAGGYAAAAPFLLWSEIASDNPRGVVFVAFFFAVAVSLLSYLWQTRKRRSP
jgi:hypothetical protein